jgi:hypothetical protein
MSAADVMNRKRERRCVWGVLWQVTGKEEQRTTAMRVPSRLKQAVAEAVELVGGESYRIRLCGVRNALEEKHCRRSHTATPLRTVPVRIRCERSGFGLHNAEYRYCSD